MIRDLRKLKEDDDVKAVVLRVNSPGGSAFASEQIWHAVKELKAKKPVKQPIHTDWTIYWLQSRKLKKMITSRAFIYKPHGWMLRTLRYRRYVKHWMTLRRVANLS